MSRRYYECMKCQARHYDEYQLYEDHLLFQSNSGIRTESGNIHRASMADIRTDIVKRLSEGSSEQIQDVLVEVLAKIDGVSEIEIWNSLKRNSK